MGLIRNESNVAAAMAIAEQKQSVSIENAIQCAISSLGRRYLSMRLKPAKEYAELWPDNADKIHPQVFLEMARLDLFDMISGTFNGEIQWD